MMERLANMTAPVSAQNCVGVVSPDTPVACGRADDVARAAGNDRTAGDAPYACHNFTIAKEVKAAVLGQASS